MRRTVLYILPGFALLVMLCSSARAHEGEQVGGGVSGVQSSPQSFTACQNGFAGIYPCRNVDLLSYLPIAAIGGGTNLNDLWGWTDPLTGREYAVVGRDTGTSFVDVTDPRNPLYLGNLPTATTASLWRGMKTYGTYAFVISEADFHGMQVFDLQRLRNIPSPPINFSADALYNGFGHCHTLAINEATGYAYAVGTNTCSGGLHMIDIHDPLHPTFAGCFSSDGYTHETQCVVYNGPDSTYAGHEICFNNNEDTLTIVDVSSKSAPVQLSRTGYTGRGYTHQGWLTADQRYFLLDDELDERNFAHATRTYVWNVVDLNAPFVAGTFTNATLAIDHNQYTRLFPYGEYTFQANYRSGLRVLRIDNPATAALREVAYFDVYPVDDNPAFNGAWSNYPFFASGTVLIGGIEQGLFAVQPNIIEATPTSTASHSPTSTPSPTRTSTPEPTGSSTPTPSATNSATVTNTLPPTATFTPGPPGFSGEIHYRMTGDAVADVTVQLHGPTPGNTATGINGGFALDGLTAEAWQIMPEKTGGASGAVTAIDATLVLQAVVGLRHPDAAEFLAGDVNGSGTLTAIDATFILQRVVGLIQRFPVAQRCGSDWAFLPIPLPMPGQESHSPSINNSSCQMGNIVIDPLSERAYGQNFTAVLFGDTQPTWAPPGGTCASCGGKPKPASIRAGRPQRGRGSRLIVPLYLNGSTASLGFETQLHFDSAHLHLLGWRRTSATRGALVIAHSPEQGRLRLAVARAAAIEVTQDPVLLVVFAAEGGASGRSTVRVEPLNQR
jgi:choice-of-anchor B domain-containing protein